MKNRLSALLAVAWATPAVGGAADTGAGTGFEAFVIPSVQYAHGEIWRHTPVERGPVLPGSSEIVVGQRLDLLVLAQKYSRGEQDRAHITYDLVIHRPDGTTTDVTKGTRVVDRPGVPAAGIVYPVEIVAFSVDPGEPVGSYRFECVVTDHIGGTTAVKTTDVKVVPASDSAIVPAEFDPFRFFNGYHQQPQPRLVLPMLSAVSRTPAASRRADLQGATLGFCEQILIDNPWLNAAFDARFAAANDAAERRLLALVLAFARRDDPRYGENLPPALRSALAAARAEPLPVPAVEPATGGQLDVHWGRFFASGRFQPIADLVSVVEKYHPHRGRLAAYKQQKRKPKTVPAEVRKDALYGVAVWSLGSNAHQHHLVRSYLLHLQQAPATSLEIRKVLAEILAWTPSVGKKDSVAPE